MLTFDTIFDAVHNLSYEDKLKLRTLLDHQIESAAFAFGERPNAKNIIGLFADEPELIDEVLKGVHERRTQPLRIEE